MRPNAGIAKKQSTGIKLRGDKKKNAVTNDTLPAATRLHNRSTRLHVRGVYERCIRLISHAPSI